MEIEPGNSTLKLTSWDLFPFKVHRNSATMDLSGMDYLHLSVFQSGDLDANNKTASISVWINDKNNNTAQSPLLNIKKGEWTSVNFSMDYFKDIDLTQVYVIRLKVGGYPTQDIYVDNIFAYKGEVRPGEVTDPYEEGEDKVAIQDKEDGVLPPMDQTYLGVNLASASGGNVPGTFGTDYIYPKFEDLYYFKAKGIRLLRIPFRAPRLQHELGGELDYDAEKSDIKVLAEVVKEAERLGMWVLFDMHDYFERTVDGVKYEYGVAGRCEWNSATNSWGSWEAMDNIVVTQEHFADLWQKIAKEFCNYSNIWGYDLMNEPKGIDIDVAFNNYQAAINAIREVDTKAQIVVEGKNYASAQGWENVSDKLKDLTDPCNKIVYQAHTYFDKDNSGTYQNTYDQEVGQNVEIYKQRLDPFIAWLKKNNKKGMLGEFGVPYNGSAKGDERYMVLIDSVFSYLKPNQLTSTYWCRGAMYDAYALSVQPEKDYATEKSTMGIMEKYIQDFNVDTSVDGTKTTDHQVFFTPNPVEQSIVVRTDGDIRKVSVYNTSGQEVSGCDAQGETVKLNVAYLTPGYYLLRIQKADGNVIVHKMIKK
ncbi:MAG: cellulase family glycosylhydrolase [Paraprevotella sp.]|nr:cellulase family glycosylhydrolase [Paraprevotella sp.]